MDDKNYFGLRDKIREEIEMIIMDNIIRDHIDIRPKKMEAKNER